LSDKETVLPLAELESFLTPLVKLFGMLMTLDCGVESDAGSVGEV
jgi:hypothetical protein